MKESAQPIEINEQKYEVYVSANQIIHERLGCSPGPEYLMALILEVEEDATDVADIYCHTILQLLNS